MDSKELKERLWLTAKKLNSNAPDSGMHMALGLLFLKFITDIPNQKIEPAEEEVVSYNDFFVPQQARWHSLVSFAGDLNFGEKVDEAIEIIEELNENIKGILPKGYSDSTVNNEALSRLVSLMASIPAGNNTSTHNSLANAFDHLLEKFALGAGKAANRFYTPVSVAKLLAETVEPRKGKVYDACCGLGNGLVQCSKFLQRQKGKNDDLQYFGQDESKEVIKVAAMNVAVHGISGSVHASQPFTTDNHPSLRADYIIANARFNNKTTGSNSATFGYGKSLEFILSKLAPTGTAGIVLGTDSVKSKSAEERATRKKLVDAGLVDCIVSLPGNLFAGTNETGCLWLLSASKTNNKYRDPAKEILFISAKSLGKKNSTGRKELTDDNILSIKKMYHRWRSVNGDYMDKKGFCKAVATEEVVKNKYVLLPEKYIASRKIKKAFFITFLFIAATALFFLNSKNSFFTTVSKSADSAVLSQPKVLKESVPVEKKVKPPVRKKVKQIAPKTDTVPDQQEQEPEADTVITADTAVVQQLPEAKAYRVISKAYFYNEPDEKTRRAAFINHWNNSYADIRAIDEKNGFIYVVFTNHLHQTSKGWLRKQDLK